MLIQSMVPALVAKELDKVATRNHRSRSREIARAIELYLSKIQVESSEVFFEEVACHQVAPDLQAQVPFLA